MIFNKILKNLSFGRICKYLTSNEILKYFDINKVLKFCDARVIKFGAPYKIFAIFGIVNYPAAYFIRVYIQDLPETESLFLRLLATILCVGLLIRNYWAKALKKYLSLYWYITITIAVPMHMSYLLMKNNFSLEWIVNFSLALSLPILILDWLMFLICMSIGTVLGYLVFVFQYGFIEFQVDIKNIHIAVYLYSVIILFCMLFARNRDIFNLTVSEFLRKKVDEKAKELKKSLAAKESFLNFVSHEIRGPVQVITILSEDLLENRLRDFDKETLESVNYIYENSQKLTYLINDWMDVSSMSRQSSFKMEKNNLLKLVEDMVQNMNLLARKKNVTISLHKRKSVDIKSYEIVCDKYRIEQVFSNICSNAIKFSPKNSKITVDVYNYYLEGAYNEKINGLCVAIKDLGKGVNEKDLKLIFELFVQKSKTKDKSTQEGLGLGLALSKKIIDRHSGKIWADNNKDSPGSSFYFFIPFGIKEDISVDQLTKLPQIAPSFNILFLDDEELCCISAKIFLIKLGHRVNAFTQVEEFFEYLENFYQEIDVIFVDIMMPISGIDVIKQIKANKKYSNIAIIAQSGITHNEGFSNLFSLGNVGFVSKPYNAQLVQEEMMKIVDIVKNYKN